MSTPRRAPRIEPFPFRHLEGLTRAEIAFARRVRRVVSRAINICKLSKELENIVGVPVRARLKTVREATSASLSALPEGAVGVLLAPADRARARDGARVLVVAEPALAATVTALALGRAPPPLLAPLATPSPELAGALAAIVRAVAARAHADAAPAVLHAGPGGPMLLDLASAGAAIAANLTVLVGDEAFSLLVVVDAAGLPADSEVRGPLEPPAWEFSRAALASLGPTPLALRVVVASCLASVGELRRLAPGDVLLTGVPSAFAGPAAPPSTHGYVGKVTLVAPRGEVGLVAELLGPDRLVLSAGRVAMPLVATDAPSDRSLGGGYPRMDPKDTAHALMVNEANDVHDALADVPLVVRVEIGAAELSASAWADTRPGDVLALGRGVGEPVVLRVSGTEVARGELVAIEGELGVRILSRAFARAPGDEVAS